MKEVEFFDTDFLGNKIEIGDKVIFESLKYKKFVIGTVISKAPKSCQIEFLNTLNYSKGFIDVVRQCYDQVIKYPFTKEGKWVWINQAKDYLEPPYGDTCKCSVCEYEIDVSEAHYKYCPNCGAKMNTEVTAASPVRPTVTPVMPLLV